jgi:hypothetical protein
MSSRADDLRAKVARQHEISPAPEPDTAATRQPRSKPVRRTVDLPAAHHTALNNWCTDAAEQLGQARVTGQEVLRALVARLLSDDDLANAIRHDLSVHQ